MKTSYHYRTVYTILCICLALISLSFNIVFADEQEIDMHDAMVNSLTAEIKKDLSSDLNNELKKIKKTSGNLSALHKAQKAGLSDLIKRISPEGGQFVIQPDGAIRIIPKNDSIIKKLLATPAPTSAEDSNAAKTSSTSASASIFPKTDSDKKDETETLASPQKVISQSEKKTLEQLLEANSKGLVDLLKKLAPGGGKFELVGDGSIRIIPEDASKPKELANVSKKASKVVKEKKLDGLSRSLKRIGQPLNTWGKVQKAANKWLKKQNKKDLFVGKIRRVNRLYIVSIVTQKGNLDSQLVMRVSDGKAVVFSKKDFKVLN